MSTDSLTDVRLDLRDLAVVYTVEPIDEKA